MAYSRIEETPWAMLESMLPTLKERVERAADSGWEAPLPVIEHHAALEVKWDCCGPPEAGSLGSPRSKIPEASMSLGVPRSKRTVAVLPIRGVIDKNRSYFADVYIDEISAALAGLMGNDSIGAVVLDIDSPGGTTSGLPEFAEEIRGFRGGDTPIYTLANGLMASAAYWLGTAATKSFATPSSQVGSIGVWMAHMDASKMLDERGIKFTIVSAGKYKTERSPTEPLGDEARAAMLSEVNAYYDMFVEAVAKNRNRRVATVRSGFGEGRMLMAEAALAEGMIDGIATLPELLGAIVPQRRGPRRATAEAELAIEEAAGDSAAD